MRPVFEFSGSVVRYNTYGDRIESTTPLSVLGGNQQEATEKARVVFGAKYDDFRNFWSHRFIIDSVREVTTNKEETE